MYYQRFNLNYYSPNSNPMDLNWKLIIRLSAFGLAMAIGTVWWISSSIEPLLWLAIFIYCAYMVAQQATSKYFLHGFMISLVNCIWVTSAHIIFFSSYAASHPQEIAMNTMMPTHPRLMMLIMGPIIGIISGLVLGLFCFIAAKIARKS